MALVAVDLRSSLAGESEHLSCSDIIDELLINVPLQSRNDMHRMPRVSRKIVPKSNVIRLPDKTDAYARLNSALTSL